MEGINEGVKEGTGDGHWTKEALKIPKVESAPGSEVVEFEVAIVTKEMVTRDRRRLTMMERRPFAGRVDHRRGRSRKLSLKTLVGLDSRHAQLHKLDRFEIATGATVGAVVVLVPQCDYDDKGE